MNTMWSDIKFSLRQWRKRPGFAITVVAILALGIGANTAIFNLLYAVLLRPLPVNAPQELALLSPQGSFPGGNMRAHSLSYPMYEFLKEQNDVFSGLLGRCRFDANIGSLGQTHRVKAEMVSGDYFQTLGLASALGRVIVAEDNERPGEHPVAVLSHSFWKTHFGGDLDVVGTILHVNGYPLTVIGVSEEGFTGVEPGFSPQVRVPLMMAKQMIPHIKWVDLDDPLDRWIQIFGRRKPGVSPTQAQAALAPLHSSFVARVVAESMGGHPEKNKERYRKSSLDVLPGQWGTSRLQHTMGRPLWMLMAMVALVLLLACVNIANLMIGRSVLRQGELAVRNAMGAGRGRLVAQLFVESALLAVLGALAGIWAASWTTQLLIRFIPASEGPPYWQPA